MAGDRRATAANMIVYDRADKVLEIDRHSLMAIAGSSGDRVGNGTRPGTFISVLPPHSAPGAQPRWEGAGAFEALARQSRLCPPRGRRRGPDLRNV
jgi:hypothetical protein